MGGPKIVRDDRQGDETRLIAAFHPVGPRTTKIHLRFVESQMSKFPGGHRGRVPPVPIPNTEVKPATADGTACAGVWESRSLPGLFLEQQKGTPSGVLERHRARFQIEAGSFFV